MNDPTNPLGWDVWRRGAALGLRLALVFFVATGAVFLLLGPVGWSGALRALCAMAVGPVFAVAAIVAWWLWRRPVLASPDKPDSRRNVDGGVGGGSEKDDDSIDR